MTENKTAVGTIFISSKSERILLNLRAEHKTHSLCWSLWGGMSEEDETPRETLLRELFEEMGYIPEISKIYPFDIYESKDKHFRYYSFVCVVENEFTPILNNESDGYAWIKLGVWPKPMHEGAKISFCKENSLERLRMILEQHK